MKKYLKEIELSGILLMFIGVVMGHLVGLQYGAWPCGVGMLLMLLTVVYKAFRWQEYERENKRNIAIVLGTIVLLYLMILMR